MRFGFYSTQIEHGLNIDWVRIDHKFFDLTMIERLEHRLTTNSSIEPRLNTHFLWFLDMTVRIKYTIAYLSLCLAQASNNIKSISR